MTQRQHKPWWAAVTQHMRRMGRMRLLVSIVAAWFLALFAPLFCILHCHLGQPDPRPQGAGAIFLCHFSTSGDTAGAPAPAQPPTPLPLPRVVYDLVLVSLILLHPLRAIARVAASFACAHEHVGTPPPTPPPQPIP
jgi:hypothetical protein